MVLLVVLVLVLVMVLLVVRMIMLDSFCCGVIFLVWVVCGSRSIRVIILGVNVWSNGFMVIFCVGRLVGLLLLYVIRCGWCWLFVVLLGFYY